MSAKGRRRKRVEPTDEWLRLVPLFEWPEQENYEAIRPLVLFGEPVAGRAEETGFSERTLYRRLERFDADGMRSLFDAEGARRRALPPAVRRLIVDAKAEYPAFNLNEIANLCYVCFGRKPDPRTVRRVLDEEPMPLKILRRYPPYHEMAEPRERRTAIVALHAEGWSAKAIAGYLKTSKPTVYRALKKWIEGGLEGLDDVKRGQKGGVRKVTLAAMDAVRRLQENPGLGEFRVHAALEQKRGAKVSVRTVGRVMAVHRELYGLAKPRRSPREKAEMPFRAKRRHEIWTADVRYVPHSIPNVGNAYVIAVLENYSRCVLASSVSLTQDTTAFLRVLYAAVERYGPPERLVTDGGGIFKAKQSRSVYRALGVEKERIERRKPYQSYIETAFGIQKRMADWHFAKAETFPELARAHDTWREDYNAQRHWAHEKRADGRRSPRDVLGFYTALLRHREEDLRRAFFSTRHAGVLDALGYARFLNWRLYGEEALARREAAVWLQPGSLTLEYGGETLSSCDVELARETGKPEAVGGARLFVNSYVLPQLRLFKLEETGWLKAMRLEGYAPRRPAGPVALQGVLFPYLEAL